MRGEYRKIHPTIGEMNSGVMPGPLNPPVFQTDFGAVGAQICFDIEWPDGWRKLREAGAEMVFWPSAFAGSASTKSAFNSPATRAIPTAVPAGAWSTVFQIRGKRRTTARNGVR